MGERGEKILLMSSEALRDQVVSVQEFPSATWTSVYRRCMEVVSVRSAV